MQTLPETLVHSGYTLTQVERTETTAIYSKRKPGHHNDHYEAIRIRIAPAATPPSGSVLPEREIYPNSEAWGTDGFTSPTLEHAREIVKVWQGGGDSEAVRAILPRLRKQGAQVAISK